MHKDFLKYYEPVHEHFCKYCRAISGNQIDADDLIQDSILNVLEKFKTITIKIIMWTEKDNKLVADFEFEDFVSAFSFMTKVAMIAEKMDHHPFWTNVYNKVTIELSTHDAGNIVTEKDHNLAQQIDRLLH